MSFRTCSLLLLFAFITFAHGKEPAQDKSTAQDTVPAAAPVDLDAKARLMQKMDETIIPSVHFQNATLDQALEFLRKKSRELDKSSAPSGAKGVNIILREPELPHESRITLDLKNVPLSEALRYVAELTNTVYLVEAQRVVLADMHAYQRERYTRTFKVPPDFLSSAGGSDPPDSPADPFASPAPATSPPVGKIPRRSAQQILEAAGVTFPEKSSASYNPLTSLLKITNTLPNLDLVEAYCYIRCSLPPKIIAFNLTLLEAPGDLIRQINAEASNTADASKLLATLLDLAQKPGSSVRVAGSALIETKSGVAATTEAVCKPWLANNVSADLGSRSSAAPEMRSTGLRLQLEPTVHPDGQTIELGLDLALSPSSSPRNGEPGLSAPRTDHTAPEPATDIPNVHLTSNLLMRSGTTKLAGIARPPALPQKTDDILWAVFITSGIRYVETHPHHLALGIPSTSKPPKSLSSVNFQIPAGLFESIMEPSPKPLRDWLIDQGVTFPQGATIELKNNLLHMANTEENIGIISTLIAAAVQKATKTAAFTLHTVRLPAAFLHKLSLAALASTDQSAEWQEVEAAAARGEAVFLESCFLEARSGTHAMHRSGRECCFLDQTAPKDKTPPGFSINGQTLGSFLEIEPTLSADGRIMEVDYAHELHVTVGSPDEASPDEQAKGRDLSPPGTSIRTLKIHSRTTMQDGDTRLIALHQDIDRDHPDHVWATFLLCNTVPFFPKPPPALAVKAPSSADSDKLETRTYLGPPGFIQGLNALADQPPVEPAVPFAATNTEVRHSRVRSPQILESLGLTFPEGASASFNPKTSTLVVRNTLTNHALIAAAIEKLIRTSPCTIAITTHVLQGPGPLLRRLTSQAASKSDHSTEFNELLASAKTGTVLHLDTARLETKPGTRTTVYQGLTHNTITEFSLDDKARPVFKRDTRHVGLNLELEPTSRKESPLVDLVLSTEFHTAPPFEHREHLIDTQGRRLEFPLTDFFTTKLNTGITIPSGTARLLSLSKPTGNPEFEKQDILQAIFITCDILRQE